MKELFAEIEFEDYKEIFMYGSPPVYMQLLIFNAVVIAFFVWRIMSRKRRLNKSRALTYKVAIVAFNFLILFQQQYDLRGMMDTIGIY